MTAKLTTSWVFPEILVADELYMKCWLMSEADHSRAMRDTDRQHAAAAGHLPRLPGPIVRNAPNGERELTMARWGMPRRRSWGRWQLTR
jgi:hypothetical protein